jgi:hypothetical protein
VSYTALRGPWPASQRRERPRSFINTTPKGARIMSEKYTPLASYYKKTTARIEAYKQKEA